MVSNPFFIASNAGTKKFTEMRGLGRAPQCAGLVRVVWFKEAACPDDLAQPRVANEGTSDRIAVVLETDE
jgi:hypothetical protein